jgi:hypothetical protein
VKALLAPYAGELDMAQPKAPPRWGPEACPVTLDELLAEPPEEDG